jgi:hypothetical protein
MEVAAASPEISARDYVGGCAVLASERLGSALSGNDWREQLQQDRFATSLIGALDPVDGSMLSLGERVWVCKCRVGYHDASHAFLVTHNRGVCVSCGRVGLMQPIILSTSRIKWMPMDEGAHPITPGSLQGESSNGTSDESTGNPAATAGMWLGLASIFLYPFGVFPIVALVCSGIGLSRLEEANGKGKVASWIGIVLGSIYSLMYLFY